MGGRFRSRYGRVAVARAALVVFLLFCALIAGIVFTLDLSARRSNSQQAATELASTARVAASTFPTMHANLRARVGELAASNSLQQALLHKDGARLRTLAASHDASASVAKGRIELGKVSFLAKETELDSGGASLVAVEPVSAVQARLSAYRRRPLFAAGITSPSPRASPPGLRDRSPESSPISPT
ncbi:MAG: hypothetical protein H0W90_00965 [Actinobacteria bacterium]|nr:hypothetical protein [Actinomycetota bacterium]